MIRYFCNRQKIVEILYRRCYTSQIEFKVNEFRTVNPCSQNEVGFIFHSTFYSDIWLNECVFAATDVKYIPEGYQFDVMYYCETYSPLNQFQSYLLTALIFLDSFCVE